MMQTPAAILNKIREQRPLVLNLTNSVVQPLTANLLLAIGGVPAMLNDGLEAEEMLRICGNALLINVGTLSQEQAACMRQALTAAKEYNRPWVLDPVAVGLLSFRTDFCAELLNTHAPTIIRGNATEIMALAGLDATCRGPESTHGAEAAIDAALSLAQKHKCAVLVTGEIDYATDGASLYALRNGHEIMTRVTGVGCAMGALTAACAAVANSPLEAAIATAAILGLAGERAAALAPQPGSFAVALLDELDRLQANDLDQAAQIKKIR